MTTQEPSPIVGPLGTHATIAGGTAAQEIDDQRRLIHTTMAPYGITAVPVPENQPYWDGAKEGKLVIQRCQSCGFYNHPPVVVCNSCCDRDAEQKWEQVSGRGTLYTHYICYDTSIAGFEEKVPYAVILVELEEQSDLLLMGNILNLEYDAVGTELPMGLPLEVIFDKASDEINIPQWQPRSS
jgi:hypothetical protein